MTNKRLVNKKETETRQHILNVAEELFSESGFDGTPLRAITVAANVNTAAVNYHFGTKLGLLKAVYQRKAKPINIEIHNRFDDCEQLLKQNRLDVEDVIRAFMEPMLDCHHLGKTGKAFRKLIGRIASTAGREKLPIMRETFGAVAKRFINLLKIVIPDMTNEEYFWRLACVYGSVLYILADEGWLNGFFDEGFTMEDDDGAKAMAIPMLVRGMTSSPVIKK